MKDIYSKRIDRATNAALIRAIHVVEREEEERAWGAFFHAGMATRMGMETVDNPVFTPPCKGHTVVGVLRSGVLGFRHYDVSDEDRSDLAKALLETTRSRLVVFADVDEPQCLAHDDCEMSEELGRACWASAHGSPARAGDR